MLISKFDLYKKEWLDLVFANRNQQYGAYDLRIHYSNILARAMGITFLGIAVIAITTIIVSRNRPIAAPLQIEKIVNVDLSRKIYTMPEHKVAPKLKTTAAQPAKATPVSVQKFIEMKVAPDAVAVDPPKLDPGMAVGPVEIKVPGGASAQNADPGTQDGTGDGSGTKPGPDVYELGGDQPQVMPEPVGGQGAWAKFLQKNMRYPKTALEEGVQGKVYMSFIIEKDGHLSNIVVERKAGFGFDEEALRVLKLAPAWKPGMQNGQAVRVRYVIPINFQLAE